eukprot:2489934-Pyramimonas_sp.AAC.1
MEPRDQVEDHGKRGCRKGVVHRVQKGSPKGTPVKLRLERRLDPVCKAVSQGLAGTLDGRIHLLGGIVAASAARPGDRGGDPGREVVDWVEIVV